MLTAPLLHEQNVFFLPTRCSAVIHNPETIFRQPLAILARLPQSSTA
jgi:hypothetical protein